MSFQRHTGSTTVDSSLVAAVWVHNAPTKTCILTCRLSIIAPVGRESRKFSHRFVDDCFPAAGCSLRPFVVQTFAQFLAQFLLTPTAEDDFLHWLGAELGSLGLDVALPAGRPWVRRKGGALLKGKKGGERRSVSCELVIVLGWLEI